MAVSSNSFHGTGVKASPAIAPPPIARHISSIGFMVRSLLMAAQAPGLDLALAMTPFAIAHLHAFVFGAVQAR